MQCTYTMYSGRSAFSISISFHDSADVKSILADGCILSNKIISIQFRVFIRIIYYLKFQIKIMY